MAALASCPFCGASRPEAAVRFCLACGRKLPTRDEDTALPHRAAAPGSPQRPGRGKPAPARSSLVLALVAVVVIAGGGTGAYLLLQHKDRTPAGTSHEHKTAAHPSSQGSGTPLPTVPEQSQITQFLTAIRGSVAARTLVKYAVSRVGRAR